LQRYLDLPKDKTVSLTGYYPESSYNRYHKDQKKRLASIYEPAHDVLIGKSVDHLDPEEERQLILDMYPGLHAVAEKVEDDSTFAAALQSAVKNMIRYTNETRVALDLAGGGNVVLVQGERGWELKMPDPLPLGDFTLEDIVVASRQVRRGDVMDASVTNANVFNALNTVRVINALAILSGLPEEARLRIPELSEVPASAWASIFGVETRKVMKENTVG
jgi:hypothetical protein